jgi:multicomponent K+:H+ antiporter subunit D
MMAGLPPFSGFLGKVFILQATSNSPYQLLIILTVLVVSLLSIIAFTRVGFILFWRATKPEDNPIEPAYTTYQALPEQAPKRNDKTIYLLLVGLIGYMVFASPIQKYTYQTAMQIQNNALYEQTLLKTDEHGQTISVQPFDSENLPETKYGGERVDPNAHLIPYLISEETLEGEHISEYKQRQMQQQHQAEEQPNTERLEPTVEP